MGLVFFSGGSYKISIPVSKVVISIAVTTPPTKTTYTEGENFDPTGMVVTATYADGHTGAISNYSIVNGTNMLIGQTSVTIKCISNDIELIATQSITVEEAYDSTFANNSWSQIIKACQTNKVPSTWTVGNYKTMSINGTDLYIDIIGVNHDTYADGSGKAPLTFQLHNVRHNYQMHIPATNSVGWSGSLMRNTYMPQFLAMMPSEVQAGIKAVAKPCVDPSNGNAIISTSDKLFLLSEMEVFGRTTYSAAAEGTQYSYYTNRSKVKFNVDEIGTPQGWWTRSPSIQFTNRFVIVDNGGATNGNSGTANLTGGTAPAFCF